MLSARKTCLAAVLAAIALTAASPPQLPDVIAGSRVVPRGTYQRPSADAAHPALTIRGSNLTVDFSGVVLRGAAVGAAPDTFTGVAVFVDGGENVTLKNLTARGYKVGVLARGTKGLHITGADLGYNWKARLYSLVEHESLLDWLSYHHNEKDEWLDGGAGIYLADTENAEIDHSTIVQGQNGLLLARSNGAKIWNNTFSYLSGLGIGLYQSSGNVIQHNRVDYCVRGYSEGFYNRGQDSAGILIYEQSSRNTVAFNSVTHDGDGLFLWAGQTTMDAGAGGANDNVFYDNDFSFAPTNGIEATFSRNAFVKNRIEGNWHGVWGGYSYESVIRDNRFRQNVEGIAIEHGQDNRIDGNTFDHDATAIHLWQNKTQDPDWGYPKHHDTRSRDYDIIGNAFIGNKVAVQLGGVDRLYLQGNRFDDVATRIDPPQDLPEHVEGHPLAPIDVKLPSPLPGGMDARVPDAERRGRDSIIVDEWGPYDWKSPKLWPAGRSDARPLRLRVLGPRGEWRLDAVRGATVSPARGTVPGEIVVTPSAGALEDFDVRLAYRGGRVVSPRGEVTPAGKPYTFSYASFFVPADWTVKFFGYDTGTKLDDPGAFARVTSARPLKVEHRDRLDFMSGRAIADGVPPDRVAIIATAEVTLPAGEYRIRTISDDGVRVDVDDERVIDHWAPHESALDTAVLTGGKHRLTVAYYEVGGFAELRFDILRR